MTTKSMSTWILACVMSVPATAARAQTLTPSAQLRKLSLSVRGELPAPEEYNSVLNTAHAADALNAKIETYVNSDEFRTKFFERVMQSLRFNANGDLTNNPDLSKVFSNSGFSPDNNLSASPGGTDFANNLNDALRQDESWDQIIADPLFQNSAQVADMEAYLNNAMNSFYGANLSLQTIFSISQAQATAILLGVQPYPIKETAAVKNIMNRLATLDPQTAQAVKNTDSHIAAYQIALVGFYAAYTKGLITVDDYNGIKATLDSASQAQAIDQGNQVIYGTDFDALAQNTALWDDVMTQWTVQVRQQHKNISDVAIEKFPAEQRRRWHAMIDTKIRELAQAQGQNSGSMLGVVMSTLFGSRFTQTRYSKAAAMFRIFMCDEMKPIAIGGVDLAARAATGIKPLTPMGMMSKFQPTAANDPSAVHASNAVCQGCHRKLDPAQAAFNGSVEISADKPLTFVYDDELSQEQRIQITSIEDLVPTLQKQRAYKVCQIRKFWNWYVGSDIPLTADKLTELIPAYDSSKSVSAFVKTILRRPEIAKTPTADETANFESVRPIFQRCNSCHISQGDIADFTQIPFTWMGGDASSVHKEHIHWLGKIITKTGLIHNGEGAKMPPAVANWRLDSDQLMTMARWISHGAMDSSGQPTISADERAQLLTGASADWLQAVKDADKLEPKFSNNWLRYLEGNDFLRVLLQIYPGSGDELAARKTLFLPQSCSDIIGSPGSFGYADRMTGMPVSRTASYSLLALWSSCVEDLGKSYLNSNADSNTDRIARTVGLVDSYTLLMNLVSPTNSDGSPNSRYVVYSGNLPLIYAVHWSQLQPELRHAFVLKLIDHQIGSGVLTNEKREQMARELEATVDGTLTNNNNWLFNVTATLVTALSSRDEFLSF